MIISSIPAYYETGNKISFKAKQASALVFNQEKNLEKKMKSTGVRLF